jgi:hypothetical protein
MSIIYNKWRLPVLQALMGAILILSRRTKYWRKVAFGDILATL